MFNYLSDITSLCTSLYLKRWRCVDIRRKFCCNFNEWIYLSRHTKFNYMNFKLSFERKFMPEKELYLLIPCTMHIHSELMDQQSRILNKMVTSYGFETFSTNIRIIRAGVTRKKTLLKNMWLAKKWFAYTE